METLFDKPEPGAGYLIFNIAFILALIAIPVLITFLARPPWLIALILFFIFTGTIALFGLIIHAAYNTTYSISNGHLELKCGYVINGAITLNKIKEIRRVNYISRVLGWGIGNRGFCNRFKDGLCLITEKEKIFISPSNAGTFMARLKER